MLNIFGHLMNIHHETEHDFNWNGSTAAQMAARAATLLQGYAKTDRYCLLSNQTGDVAHVLAAVMYKEKRRRPPRTAVLIIRSAHHDASRSMIRDFKSVTLPNCTLIVTQSILNKPTAFGFWTQIKRDEIVRPLTGATKDAKPFIQALAKNPLTLDQKLNTKFLHRMNAIKAYCKMEAVSHRDMSKIACIWIRRSGKRTATHPRGGANPQFDSSNSGTAQICNKLAPSVEQILLIGEGTEKVERHLLAHTRSKVVVLGQYWRKHPFNSMARFEQALLFHYLVHICHCSLVHIGMKSGQMDSLALWKQATVFIEDEASPTKSRSNHWNYRPLLQPVFVDCLPTRTGQVLRLDPHVRASVTEDQWSLVDHAKMIPMDAIFPRGFTPKDLEKICCKVLSFFSAQRSAILSSINQ